MRPLLRDKDVSSMSMAFDLGPYNDVRDLAGATDRPRRASPGDTNPLAGGQHE